jgi:MFS family permease
LLQNLRFATRALRHRDLRIFYAGQGTSMIGTWMQNVAMGWLVYRLTGSPMLLGVIGFSSQFPTFFMAPIAGALADRWSRYYMVLLGQTLLLIQAAVLSALVLSGVAQVWHLIVLSIFLGLSSGLDVPARQSLLVRLVKDPEDLPNAIALNSALFNGGRLIGPAIAGILIGLVGEGVVFLLNAVSYVVVLIALLSLGLRRTQRPPPPPGSMFSAMREGFRYGFGFAPIRVVLTVLGLVSLVGFPYAVLLPVVARDVLGGDARTLGILTSSAGLGALMGTFYLASRSTVRGIGRVIASACCLFGTGLMAFSLSRDVRISSVVLLFTGFGVVVTSAGINTFLQTLVDEEMRGRVMSMFTMAFVGASPFGSLLAGWLAVRIGAPAAIRLGGAVCVLVGIWLATRIPSLRLIVHPVYIRRGIMPEVAKGLQTATELPPKV